VCEAIKNNVDADNWGGAVLSGNTEGLFAAYTSFSVMFVGNNADGEKNRSSAPFSYSSASILAEY
jgi:hypothetical protein